jgi:hypothetical protein
LIERAELTIQVSFDGIGIEYPGEISFYIFSSLYFEGRSSWNGS